MGWAYCGTNPDTGEEMGYGVKGICHYPECNTKIYHGLCYLCGAMHNDGVTCNHYYCPEHLVFGAVDGEGMQMCQQCYDLYADDEGYVEVGDVVGERNPTYDEDNIDYEVETSGVHKK